MIMILGCGRSGTHLLAEVMKGPDTHVEIENPKWFELALAMVRNEATKDKYMGEFLSQLAYMNAKAMQRGKIFVDKTHVAALFLEQVMEYIPLETIWIERDPVATVASMKQHNGMRNDLAYSRCFSVPNRFMGIKDESWFDLPIVSCFAHKWVSFLERREELEEQGLIDHYVTYEGLLLSPDKTISGIEEKFSIRCSRPAMNLGSLDKWQTVLKPKEIELVEEITGGYV